jgi:hypothetical protein
MGMLQESKALPELTAMQKVALSAIFWEWYFKHSGDTIVKKTILVFKVTIKVKDVRPIFEQLFGNPPPGSIPA